MASRAIAFRSPHFPWRWPSWTFGKVLSPQFLVRLLPMAALVAPTYPALAILTLALLALTQVGFPGFYWRLVALDPVAICLVAARNLILGTTWGLALRALCRVPRVDGLR